MKNPKYPNVFFLLIFQPIILNFMMYCCLANSAFLSSETDKQALLAFRDGVTQDPFGALMAWNDSLDICQWPGVTCSSQHHRVTALNLHSKSLKGSISPYIGNLTFLRRINLQNNSIHGGIPLQIGRLFRLQVLLLSRNMLQGEIPANISHCLELRILDLVMNNLEGDIPTEFGALSKLAALGLANNNLTGLIPQSLSNLSSLEQLTLSENSLSGSIPIEFGQLRQLKMFQVSANKLLRGPIPIQLFNISSMEYFGVAENELMGEIPSYIGLTLPNLVVLLLGGNRFTGQIPNSISNASRLQRLDFSLNYFTGSIPKNLGNLKNLQRLNFGINKLGTEKGDDDLAFLSSLVNCTKLQVLAFGNNSLRGQLPDSIANLSSQLTYLYMGANQISGSIPSGIGNLKSLTLIGIEKNLLKGAIPTSIGYLLNLQILSLFGNSLSGTIPSSLGNCTFLSELSLDENDIHGTIPSTLGQCQSLQKLGLSENKLSGPIPIEVIGLPSLSGWLDLSSNKLTGPIPLQVGNLRSIEILDLAENNLTGEIPSSLGHCLSLGVLNLSGNSFRGPISSSLGSLRGLKDIDLSRNNFSGGIPDFLGSFSFLKRLDLSFNELRGEVPRHGIFKNASAIAISGNDKLCGGIPELHLHSCSSQGSKKRWQRFGFKLVLGLSVGCSLLILCPILILYRKRCVRKNDNWVENPLGNKFLKVSYAELFRATQEFSPTNLIGIGGYGSVYKGSLVLDEGTTVVAVKVLDLQQKGASRSFLAECEALRSLRHRNLVKIITTCSTADFTGKEFKALVFEFMPNGSLENWLHSNSEGSHRQNLNLTQRLRIAIDVAHALDYLHHHCPTPVVHCDLKPTNVLLDHDMVAHVADFGLATLLYDKKPQNQTSSSSLKGSIGYVAPEYGVGGKVTPDGDIYSYGILLMELFTGKRPTDDMFKDGLSLREFAKMAIPDRVIEVADNPILEIKPQSQDSTNYSRIKIVESLISILRIAILCSSELPKRRMKIKDVIRVLQDVLDMIADREL